MRQIGMAQKRRGRGHIDDGAMAFQQMGQGRLNDEERPAHIHAVDGYEEVSAASIAPAVTSASAATFSSSSSLPPSQQSS